MPEKPVQNPKTRPPTPPLTPDPPDDGFPLEKDVSTPPPGSDQADDEKKES